MNPEDQLDHLIEAHLAHHPWATDDLALDDRMRAAEAMSELAEAPISEVFSRRLHARMMAKIDEDERTEALIAIPTPPARRALNWRAASRWWVVAASALVLIVVTTFGLTTAAAASLPGDPLWGIRQWQQQVSLSQANGPDAQAKVAIQQLRDAMGILQTTIDQRRSDQDTQAALDNIATLTRAAQKAVAAMPSGAARDSRAAELTTAITDEKALLYHLLGKGDWTVRLALSRAIATLQGRIPVITAVSAKSSNGQVTLSITGSDFVAGARVAINGAILDGAVTSLTSGQVVAIIPGSSWSGGHQRVGVVNPDGTAAQFTLDDEEGGDDHKGGNQTPGPTQTPESGDDHHGSGGGATPTSTPGGGSGSGGSGGGHGGDDHTPTPTGTPGGH